MKNQIVFILFNDNSREDEDLKEEYISTHLTEVGAKTALEEFQNKFPCARCTIMKDKLLP